jgi:protoporphyrinogen oxidase
MQVATEVRRLPRVYPLYRVGYEADLAQLDAWVDDQPNLISLGRQGRFVPDNLHHVLAMGRDAAAALRDDGSFDVAAWHRARERHAAHVVED